MKAIKVFGVVLALLLLIGGGCYLLDKEYSGSLFDKDKVTKEYVDSTVTASVQDIVNPVFSDVDEVLVFRDLTAEGLAIDEAFSTLPEEVLKNVASVVIKREGFATKRSIVYEYRANNEVYDNLPNNATPEEVNAITQHGSSGGEPVTKVDSSESKPIGRIEYTQHDTTINGKTYKVRTKKEIDYE